MRDFLAELAVLLQLFAYLSLVLGFILAVIALIGLVAILILPGGAAKKRNPLPPPVPKSSPGPWRPRTPPQKPQTRF